MNTPDRRTALSVLLVVLLLAVIVPLAVYTVPQLVGAEHSYTVVSGSMAPAISTGDAAIVNEVSPTAVEDGDVITFRRGERAEIRGGTSTNLVTHRVVEVVPGENGPAFETKGDANEDPDPERVQSDELVGRVKFTIPYIGHIVAFAGTRLGYIALVGLPITLLIANEVHDLARAAWADVGRARASAGRAGSESRAKTTAIPEFGTVVAARRNGGPAGEFDSSTNPAEPTIDGEEGADDA